MWLIAKRASDVDTIKSPSQDSVRVDIFLFLIPVILSANHAVFPDIWNLYYMLPNSSA